MSAPTTGYRKIPALGNTNHNPNWPFDLTNIGAVPFYWNGQDDAGHSATSGVYFYRIVTKDYQAINRLTLLK